MGSWYNGYSGRERQAKYRELLKRIAANQQPEASGPCMLCGDPDQPVMYHDEDYSVPYIWEPPALLTLCGNCHKEKLHKRFNRSAANWDTFLAHVRRGGYARETKDHRKELIACERAIEAGLEFTMQPLRAYQAAIGTEWFAKLRLDAASKTDPAARPRP